MWNNKGKQGAGHWRVSVFCVPEFNGSGTESHSAHIKIRRNSLQMGGKLCLPHELFFSNTEITFRHTYQCLWWLCGFRGKVKKIDVVRVPLKTCFFHSVSLWESLLEHQCITWCVNTFYSHYVKLASNPGIHPGGQENAGEGHVHTGHHCMHPLSKQ